jgi:dienelactone hydrolase
MNRKGSRYMIVALASLLALLAGCGTPTAAPTLLLPTVAASRSPVTTPLLGLPAAVYTIPGMETVNVRKDLAYDSADPFKKMDIYYPAEPQGRARVPAVILVHGTVRARDNFKETLPFISWGQLIAASGLGAVTFNWDYPQTADLDHLIQHIRTNAGTLGIDPDRLCVFAFSGGVPYGVAAAMRGSPAYVRCIVAYYGDLDRPLSQWKEEPVEQVAPLLIVMAAKDEAIPANRITPFVDYATAVGAQVELLVHPSGVHGFDMLNDDEQSRDIIKHTLEFLRVHMVTD